MSFWRETLNSDKIDEVIGNATHPSGTSLNVTKPMASSSASSRMTNNKDDDDAAGAASVVISSPVLAKPSVAAPQSSKPPLPPPQPQIKPSPVIQKLPESRSETIAKQPAPPEGEVNSNDAAQPNVPSPSAPAVTVAVAVTVPSASDEAPSQTNSVDPSLSVKEEEESDDDGWDDWDDDGDNWDQAQDTPEEKPARAVVSSSNNDKPETDETLLDNNVETETIRAAVPAIARTQTRTRLVSLKIDSSATTHPPLPPLPAPTAGTLKKVRSPHKLHRFDFLEQDRIPLQTLEEQTTRKRHEFHTQLYELDCKVGSMTARLAQEQMDRIRAFRQSISTAEKPLGEIANRVFISESSPTDRMRDLSRRIEHQASRIIQTRHVDMLNLRREAIDGVQFKLEREIIPSIRIDATKQEKRHHMLFRQFDAIAAISARRYQEESSVRTAALVVLERDMDAVASDQATAEQFLKDIRTLRLQLQKARDIRKKEDRRVHQHIHDETEAMKRALIAVD